MKGIFLLWIDVELAWGKVYRKRIDLSRARQISINVREILDSVMNLLEHYNIPVTWAILGHVLLDHCSTGSNKLPHSDMPRPNYSWLKEGWYRFDPCTDVQRDPAWYGKDVADKIVNYGKNSRIHCDIGCHSFSHQLFGDPGCGRELAKAEVKKCMGLMIREYGIVPNVFAFPRDYVGHIDVLRELGFVAFRDIPTKLYPCLKLERTISNFLKKYFSLFIQFLSYYLLIPPHVVNAKERLPGLWAVQGCLAYSKKPLIPLELVTLKAKKGINRAIREGKIFSMYTHLRNFGEGDDFLSDFEEILLYVDEKREAGLLRVMTMTELVKELCTTEGSAN